MDFLRPKRVFPRIDLAPLIDCVFQLLIFFMLTSSFARPALELTLPTATARQTVESPNLIVAIDRSGRITVDRETVRLTELEAVLARRLAGQEHKQINLRGDAEMPYRLFVQVMDRARQAGAQQLNIVHERVEDHGH
ncbi:biopolymer transporter ExbD [bacterium]|nr:biopolymer transporter ExbD [bacterium]